jgi:hypothetical protein
MTTISQAQRLECSICYENDSKIVPWHPRKKNQDIEHASCIDCISVVIFQKLQQQDRTTPCPLCRQILVIEFDPKIELPYAYSTSKALFFSFFYFLSRSVIAPNINLYFHKSYLGNIENTAYDVINYSSRQEPKGSNQTPYWDHLELQMSQFDLANQRTHFFEAMTQSYSYERMQTYALLICMATYNIQRMLCESKARNSLKGIFEQCAHVGILVVINEIFYANFFNISSYQSDLSSSTMAIQETNKMWQTNTWAFKASCIASIGIMLYYLLREQHFSNKVYDKKRDILSRSQEAVKESLSSHELTFSPTGYFPS